MAKHAIYCDGTWRNRDKDKFDTSVARFFEIHAAHIPAGSRDSCMYLAGVGANDARSDKVCDADGSHDVDRIGDPPGFWDKWTGGAFGEGLDDDILSGYRYLTERYQDGDEIYLFGFSRGATMARSLAGLVNASGLVDDRSKLQDALAWYRARKGTGEAAKEAAWTKRLALSPRYVTSQEEADWRVARGHAPGKLLKIAYVGVFDTVGTLGVGGVLAQLRLSRGRFHDNFLSGIVQAARHALALDDRVAFYRPTRWNPDGLAELNERGRDSKGELLYQELWFPGNHGKVGGSGEERRISNQVAHWIADGARDAGLDLDLQDLERAHDDYAGTLHNNQGFDPLKLVPWVRVGPVRFEALHQVSVQRLRWLPEYRPPSLNKFFWREDQFAKVFVEEPTRHV